MESPKGTSTDVFELLEMKSPSVSHMELTRKIRRARIKDWKGFVLESLGPLSLEDTSMNTRTSGPRVHQVFLFERIILSCWLGGKSYMNRTNGVE